MIDSAFPVQIGLAAALLADSGVTGLIGGSVFDPLQSANQPYPLIEIGDDQIIPNPDGVTDEVWVTVHVWADGPGGRLFAKKVGDAIRAVLAPRPPASPTLTVAGFAVVSVVQHMARYVSTNDPTDPTVTVAHGNLQFRLQLAPTA